MDNGKACDCVSKADIEKCLRRNPQSDNPLGGFSLRSNNCQSNTIIRLAKCCLKSDWDPHWFAGSLRGRCLKPEYYWEWSFDGLKAGNFWKMRCLKWEFPQWQSSEVPDVPPEDAPIVSKEDDDSHGGWESETRRPKPLPCPDIEYPNYSPPYE